MDKLDYKKAYRDLYQPGRTPALIQVPEMTFLSVEGQGDPAGATYQQALSVLYALAFSIKMSKLGGDIPEGYFEYAVPPLEGLWWCGQSGLDLATPRHQWQWLSLIRQPEFVTPAVFERAQTSCRRKKPELPVDRAKLIRLEEGLCAQIMHVGPYAAETATLSALRAWIAEQGLVEETGAVRRHHEIYLSDPRKTAPERMKTVLRLPVRG